MEWINRYIYAVTQKLPVKQRAEIEKELRGLIEDMLEERLQGKDPRKEDVEQVLLELGSPHEMADRYRDSKQYLIGPELFHSYLMVLKISVVAVSIAMAVVFAIDTIVEPQQVLEHFVDRLVGLLFGCFQAFTWVTIIFALIDYFALRNGKLDIKTASWTPSELPELPDHLTQIKRSNPISNIIFNVLFAVLFVFSIDLIGIWRFQNGSSTVVPFLDQEVFLRFLPAILAVMAISIIKDIFMLIKGKWTLPLIGFELLIAVLILVTSIWIFSDHSVWNPDFMQGLVEVGLVTAGSEGYHSVNATWTAAQAIILYLIGITIIVQIVMMVIKAYRIKNHA